MWFATGNDTGSVRTRIEFTALDLNGDGKDTSFNEGFVKVYQAVGPAGSPVT